ncbi:hypothetical protein [Winogradskyella helgolandensis]|uniref:hypothetical protein n=1 Tax=Winogradskyella helgolandensis TaxID=2697010 RepID=UPI0015C0EF2B|nr:hypothetical protein [Winogradskyella helgolandensis]
MHLTILDALNLDLKLKASGILCTAIVGGAIIPLLYGYFTDIIGFKSAFVFVIVFYGYILWYGYRNSRKNLEPAN